jgi:hypothetical protein
LQYLAQFARACARRAWKTLGKYRGSTGEPKFANILRNPIQFVVVRSQGIGKITGDRGATSIALCELPHALTTVVVALAIAPVRK